MNIYTKKGDHGRTSLLNGNGVLKTDDRIELLGTIDELSSQIGLAKVLAEGSMKEELSQIQRTLMKIMSGTADAMKREYKMDDKETESLETWIDRMEESFPREKDFVLYGGCEQSARLDVARAVARRAERQFYRTARHFATDRRAMTYINRLSDYLYVCARFMDYQAGHNRDQSIRQEVIKDVLKNTEKN